MIQTLLMDFDWTTALVRFSINTIFIASMIFIISRQTVLKRFSFTFMMISLIVFFLCYTLKNFDLNLGMALGLFAIFGIIRYRTLPLQTEEMTYLFVTIGVAVINALSEDFLTVYELIIINTAGGLTSGDLNLNSIQVDCNTSLNLSLIHISDPTRPESISYAVVWL